MEKSRKSNNRETECKIWLAYEHNRMRFSERWRRKFSNHFLTAHLNGSSFCRACTRTQRQDGGRSNVQRVRRWVTGIREDDKGPPLFRSVDGRHRCCRRLRTVERYRLVSTEYSIMTRAHTRPHLRLQVGEWTGKTCEFNV